MQTTKNGAAPTDEEILAYDTVPVPLAAAYLGCGPGSIKKALIQRRAPYGYAINSESGTWKYQISPGALVKFKHGDLPVWSMADLVEMITDGIDKVLSLRTKAAIKVLSDGGE